MLLIKRVEIISHMMRGAGLAHYQESHEFNRQPQLTLQDRCFFDYTHSHISPLMSLCEIMLLLPVNCCDIITRCSNQEI